MAGGSINALVKRRNSGGQKFDLNMAKIAVLRSVVTQLRIRQILDSVDIEKSSCFCGHQAECAMNIGSSEAIIKARFRFGNVLWGNCRYPSSVNFCAKWTVTGRFARFGIRQREFREADCTGKTVYGNDSGNHANCFDIFAI